MTDFVLVYHGGGKPEPKVLAEWGEWMQQLGDKLVDGGKPVINGKAVSSDGTVSEVTGERVSGYSIIKAETMDEAIAAAKRTPLVVNRTGSVDVYQALAI